MEHQREVHNDSWESLKPDRGTVKQKARIRETLSVLRRHVNDDDFLFDLGCGDGTMGYLLSEDLSITVDGCDISDVAVKRAQGNYRNVFRLNIDDEKLPVDSNLYDVVICTDVLEHTLSPMNALNEIGRVLKNDGVAVISVPNFGFFLYRIKALNGTVPSIVRDDRHYNAFTISYLQDMLRSCGLDVNSMSGVSKYPKLANIYPQLFGQTIIVTARPHSEK